ncbi:MAG: 4-hydroxy-tetrahydrodipicolinate synthase [Bdellovibrionaceae bacterium]|nr:4-hydroxy-tetrahydrodipicolinate synthase [Pseudobdellovibrionaceae bacterium]
MKDLSGVLTALVTPFRDGAVDFDSLKKLVRFQLDNGISGFVINGTTAESPCLSRQERLDIFACVRAESGGRVPLVMGTGSNDTRATIEATQQAEAIGADAALVVVPYYNKPPQRGLVAHYKAIAASTSLPILLYNVPGRTITRLEPETMLELSYVQGIVGVKEATGDIELGKKVIAGSKPGFLVTSGDDATYLDLTTVGGVGVISVASHILPGQFVKWYKDARAQRGEWKADFAKYKDLIDYLYVEANPIPVKTALYLMGIIATPDMRLPLVPLQEPHITQLRHKMQSAGLL